MFGPSRVTFSAVIKSEVSGFGARLFLTNNSCSTTSGSSSFFTDLATTGTSTSSFFGFSTGLLISACCLMALSAPNSLSSTAIISGVSLELGLLSNSNLAFLSASIMCSVDTL